MLLFVLSQTNENLKLAHPVKTYADKFKFNQPGPLVSKLEIIEYFLKNRELDLEFSTRIYLNTVCRKYVNKVLVTLEVSNFYWLKMQIRIKKENFVGETRRTFNRLCCILMEWNPAHLLTSSISKTAIAHNFICCIQNVRNDR